MIFLHENYPLSCDFSLLICFEAGNTFIFEFPKALTEILCSVYSDLQTLRYTVTLSV